MNHRLLVDACTGHVLGGDDLQRCVTVLALCQRLVPRPAVTVEAVCRLLAAGTVKAGRALATKTVSTETLEIRIRYGYNLQG